MTTILTIRLDRGQHEALTVLSQIDGRSKASIIRSAVDAHIDKLRNDVEFRERLAAYKERLARL